MATPPITGTTAGTAATASPAGRSSTTSAADQQDRFMQLLVAQMKNQDPLNPMDNAQMTSQIAQINTVAGIEKLNTTVESLAGQFASLRELMAQRLPEAIATDPANPNT
ncbi:flagellar hook capping FlgD N-terminal domain-containing protein [Ramlibacter sp. MAHUQ-53]|uniref:flagellar hook capping FlgD N-terminal domain-containing protein n=1 Tax=unclassified Ramlibacter TaxID=2617605 RepID=UPI0036267622